MKITMKGVVAVHRLEQKFLQQLRLLGLGEGRGAVIAAVSGGSDSMALLALLAAAAPVLRFPVEVAHCNFQLRQEESLGDEYFVEEACRELGVACHIRRFDTEGFCRQEKRSVEEGARMLRYGFFAELLETTGARAVATGHHAADNVETVLFNLFRGASLSGLGGIRPKRGSIIRPLLSFTKEELAGYLEARGIGSRIDASNLTDRHDRNFIRNRVIPLVEERFRYKLAPSLHRIASQAGELEEFLERHCEQLACRHPELVDANGEMDVDILRTLTVFERKELLKRQLRLLGAPVDADSLHRIAGLVEGGSGRRVMIAGNFEVLRKGRRLLMRRTEELPDPLSVPRD